MSSRSADAADAPLGRIASRALSWSLLNTAVSRFGTLGIGIALARILGPESFGTFAVATVALYAVLSFNELGVSLAIVRWPGDPNLIAPTVATLSVASSTLLTAGAYVAAPSFAAAMGDPSATGVVRLMTVCILINGLVAAPAALMQREFRQAKRMVVDQVNVWLGAFLSVGLAVAGMGAMSLAIGRVAGAVASAVLFLAYSPAPLRFGFDRTRLRPLLRFGLPLAGSSVIVFAVGYADQLTAGHLLGSTALGFYVLAFNLASWPVSMFSQPLRSVAPAAFARLQHDRRALTGSLASTIGLLAAVTLPICLLLAGAATPVIRFVYGEEWAPAAPILTWLAVLAAFRIIFELAYDYLVVVGRSRIIFVIQLVWLILLIPGLWIGASIAGLPGLAAAQVLIAAAVILPVYLREFTRSGLPLREIGRRVQWPVVGGLLAGASAGVAAAVIGSAVLACACAGAVTVAIIGFLVYRDRAALSALRSTSAAPVSEVSA